MGSNLYGLLPKSREAYPTPINGILHNLFHISIPFPRTIQSYCQAYFVMKISNASASLPKV
jgi:hypothetical protein